MAARGSRGSFPAASAGYPDQREGKEASEPGHLLRI